MTNKLLQLIALTALTALAGSLTAQAAPDEAGKLAQPKVLVYIQPVEYTHSIRLWSPYQDYWYDQGPIVEAEALPKLSANYTDVAMCEGNQSGKALIWLQPKMFYNPQVQMFYAEVLANAYTGVGKLIGTYKGESKVHGSLNLQASRWISSAYAQAIDDMLQKLQADTGLQSLLAGEGATATQPTPCSMVTLLPTHTIRNVSSF